MKTIFLAEGERHVLDALRLLLEEQADLKISGEAQSAEVLLAKACINPPDTILLDWNLPGIHHRRIIHTLRECCPDTKIVAMSVKPEHEGVAQEYGLVGFISKQISAAAFTTLLNSMLSKSSEMINQK